MHENTLNDINRDPFQTLGLPQDADEQAVRARYLELVKQHPPERDPDKFREIQAAYDASRDPLAVAKSLLQFPSDDSPPTWKDAIEAQRNRPPKTPVNFLLSLGNRSKQTADKQTADKQSTPH